MAAIISIHPVQTTMLLSRTVDQTPPMAARVCSRWHDNRYCRSTRSGECRLQMHVDQESLFSPRRSKALGDTFPQSLEPIIIQLIDIHETVAFQIIEVASATL